jgi:hypothetical protein
MLVSSDHDHAGLAGLVRAAPAEGVRDGLKLDSASRILAVSIEDATDPALSGVRRVEPTLY